jgi:NhaP-type Na+/H+ or K+/H+ antiporter
MAIAAIVSVVHHPIGNGWINEYYFSKAFEVGHTHSKPGSQVLHPTAPHNHFANHIMYLGVPGVVLIGLLFIYLYRMLRDAIRESRRDFWLAVLAASFFAALLNSGAHNAGLFSMEAGTCLALGGLLARLDSVMLTRPVGAKSGIKG